MINIQRNLFTAYGFKKILWTVVLAIPSMLPMLSPVQAQTPVTKTVTKDAMGDSKATPARRNSYMAGGNVRLGAPVKGNLYAAGGRITVEQPVEGDVTLAGGAVAVRAAVAGNLIAAGGNIDIESSVGGELRASGGNITLSNTAVLADAVNLYAGHVSVAGKVNGPLKVYAQKVVLNGEVTGDVDLNAEEIELGPQARLSAALRYPANAQFKTAEGAIIGGAVTRGQPMNSRPETYRDRDQERGWHGQMMGHEGGWAGTLAGIASSFVVLFAAAALLLLVFTGFSRRAANTALATPGPALAAGLGVLLGTPLLAMLLIMTLIGIPLGIVLLLLFPLMLLTGCLVGVFGVALRVQSALQKDTISTSRTAMMGFFALTLLLVLLIGSLPFIGSLILVAILLLGTGACALELYHQVKSGRNQSGSGVSGSGSSPHAPAVSTS